MKRIFSFLFLSRLVIFHIDDVDAQAEEKTPKCSSSHAFEILTTQREAKNTLSQRIDRCLLIRQ